MGLQGQPASSYTNVSTSFSLGALNLAPGRYTLSVAAVFADGGLSDMAQADVTLVAATAGAAKVYPNPWRSDKHFSLDVTFDLLSTNAMVQIFTVSGHLARTLTTNTGKATWDKKNANGQDVASGLYLYLITDDQGQRQRGKLVVIR